MNENNLFYRLFINFCVSTTVGVIAVTLEYLFSGVAAVSIATLGYIFCAGAAVGIVFEVLFVNVFPLSGNHLKRSVLWRNRLIAAVVNAALVSLLGKLMLGTSSGLLVLMLVSIFACVIAVVTVSLIADVRYRHSIKEMNRRLMQLNGVVSQNDITDEQDIQGGN